MVKSKSKEMNKWLKLVLILVIAAVFIGLFYSWFILDAQNKIERLTGGEEITSSELALTLLTHEEVENLLKLQGATLPLLPQFNDNLHAEDTEKYQYADMVARLFISKKSGDTLLEDVITLFDNEEKAQTFIMTKAEEAGARTTQSFEGTVLTLYTTQNGDENNPPSATLRFAIKNLVVKITLYGDNPTIDYTNADLLGALLLKLATEQKNKIEQLLSGQLLEKINLYQTNMALNNLPDSLSGAELIGLLPITQEEWLGETRKLGENNLQGFKSGAIASFKLPDMPGHVLSVVILEFENKEDASREQQVFFSEGAHLEDESSEVLELPKTLSDFSAARASDTMTEIQAVYRVYLYDIALFSPYYELDKANARKNIAKYGEEIFK